ncbi:Ribosome production factor 1-like [Homarus americanus]|uniref:Ribosome production factor 1-like n=1 Tax=Homarus americanus TaxID=6706 RepID=A0A8J5T3W9_HOMAM|nr:Ribosome production factor 1-like [Homarus americanus]
MAAPSEEIEIEETQEEIVPEIRPCKPARSNISDIKNKNKRKKLCIELKRKKRTEKIKEKKDRKKEAKRLGDDAPPKKQPHTIESLREKDETMVDDEDDELEQEEATDTFASYFSKSYVPKVLVTCSDNPHTVRSCVFIL